MRPFFQNILGFFFGFLLLSLGHAEESVSNKSQVAVPTPVPLSSSAQNLIEKGSELDPLPQSPPPGLIPSEIIELNSGEYFSKFIFLVDKASRSLSVWEQSASNVLNLVDLYPTDMGKVAGNKQNAGDRKTPEGIYFFTESKVGPSLDYSQYGNQAFVMDYPNMFDRRARKTGSGIWLHAIPETKTLVRGSRGCVVVRNQAMHNLNAYMDIGKTPIIVTDKAHYINAGEWNKERKYWLDWLETWRSNWASGELTAYMENYSQYFHSQGRNKTQWERYKTILKKKYEFVTVDLKHITVFKQQTQITIKFMQHYGSSGVNDVGEKTLYLENKGLEGFKIIAEEWGPLKIKLPTTVERTNQIPKTVANGNADNSKVINENM